MAYEVIAEFPREKILPLISSDENERVVINGYNVRVGSTRLQTLGVSQKCVCCGREGVVFRLERSVRKGDYKKDPNYRNTPHLNLYAIEFVKVGGSKKVIRKYVLMTRDHKYPKSYGGLDLLDNSQTMCEKCNHKKSDKIQVKYIAESAVQEMIKSIPVKHPLTLRPILS